MVMSRLYQTMVREEAEFETRQLAGIRFEGLGYSEIEPCKGAKYEP
jgi:hypothetical protein